MQSKIALAVLAVIFALHCALATKTIEAPASTLCAFRGACTSGDWVRVQKSAADEIHRVIIAVRLRADAVAACDALLMEISTPGSPKAGLRYSHDQVGQLLSDFDNTRTVEQWLRSHDLEYETASNGDFIRVAASVAQLERLLGAQFHDFTSAALGRTVRRTASIALPEKVPRPLPLSALDLQIFGNNSIDAPISRSRCGRYSVIFSYHFLYVFLFPRFSFGDVGRRPSRRWRCGSIDLSIDQTD
jgi:hypothetical protein